MNCEKQIFQEILCTFLLMLRFFLNNALPQKRHFKPTICGKKYSSSIYDYYIKQQVCIGREGPITIEQSSGQQCVKGIQ